MMRTSSKKASSSNWRAGSAAQRPTERADATRSARRRPKTVKPERGSMDARVNIAVTTILLALVACGENENGNEDTFLTGFSGVVIFGIVIWLIVRALRKRA